MDKLAHSPRKHSLNVGKVFMFGPEDSSEDKTQAFSSLPSRSVVLNPPDAGTL